MLVGLTSEHLIGLTSEHLIGLTSEYFSYQIFFFTSEYWVPRTPEPHAVQFNSSPNLDPNFGVITD